MEYPYKQVNVCGKRYDEHRYLMEQYLGRKLDRNEYVHHINGDKRDNRIENLIIMTPQAHNKLHKTKYSKTKICKVCGKEFCPPIKHRARNTICSQECWNIWQRSSTVFKGVAIEQYDNLGNYLKTFSSVKDASKEVNGLSTNIVKCAKGKIKTAYGFKWKYAKEN